MGNTISFVRHAFIELLDSVRNFQAIEQRVNAEPGLPVTNPTRSFWMFPPSPIASHCSDLPPHADIVVIGSGITGTSVARTLLDRAHAHGKLPVLLMLEARDACSGATGRYVCTHLPFHSGWSFEQHHLHRNGGHISPNIYQDFGILRHDHGDAAASKITQFRLAHLHEMRRVAEEEGILEQSQWRQVDSVEAYFNRELFARAKTELQVYQQVLASEASHYRVYESQEALQVWSASSVNDHVTKWHVEIQSRNRRRRVHRIPRWCHASVQLCDGYPFKSVKTVP